MISILERDPAFLREIEAFARGLAMYATEEDMWAGFNGNWDVYIWWDTDEETYHGCVHPVISGEIDMNQSASLNLGKYIGQDRKKRVAEADMVELWVGDFEFIEAVKLGHYGDDKANTFSACIVHRLDDKKQMPRSMVVGFLDGLNEDWLIPKDYCGEIYFKDEQR